jgi:hypothetical protein
MKTHRHHIQKIDCLMAHTALFVWLVLLVIAVKIHTEKQVLVAGTKQSKPANEANGLTCRLIRQSGLPNLLQACLLCFVPAINILWLKWMFQKLICVEQSIFL